MDSQSEIGDLNFRNNFLMDLADESDSGVNGFLSLIYLFVGASFAGKKIKTQAHMKNIFFPLEVVQGTYMNLYSFESSMKWPFLDIFTLRGHKNL